MRILLIPFLFILIGGAVVFFVGPALQFPESISEFQVWLKGFDEWAWAAGSMMIIGDSLLPIPSDPTVFTLGLIYGGLIGGLVGGTAATIAALIGYSITRSLGEEGATFLIGEKDLQRARGFYERWGFMTVALGRAIGGPAEYLVVVAGLTAMPFRKVLLAIVTGAYPTAFCMSFLGAYSMAEPYIAVTLAVALVLSLIGGFHLFRRFSERGEQRDAN
ncbi:MAG: putative membrane protein YdjX (TVP38/TMEM64 family) [Halioglobus sp.]|jgi:uncharacterized membrane protein YdjX (TVP38/TMEM64 family)